jgi:urease accessory protein
MRFEVDASDATTKLHVEEQRPPLQVVRAFPMPHAETLVHLHNVSGGVLAGDQLELDISVGPQAKAQITSTGATRVYRCEGMPAATQRVSIHVGENGVLEYLPDPLIPYAQSRYSQSTDIHLAGGASLFWWEVLAPGRFSSGEVFAYDRVHIRNAIDAGDRLVACENYLLEPGQREPGALARFGPYTHLASFYACQTGRDPKFWRSVEDRLAELAGGLTDTNRILWGVSTLASDGVAVRGLSSTGLELAAHLREFWRLAKRLITGHDAVIPRKTF